MASIGAPGHDSARRRQRLLDVLSWLRSDDWLELMAVLLLATASLAAAWSGYQASMWGGTQASLFSQASSRKQLSVEASTSAFLAAMVDQQLFNGFADAYTQDNHLLMDFYDRQFSERLRPAVEAWLATDPLNDPNAPGTPFDMSEYVVPESARAETLRAESEALFDEGSQAIDHGGQYILSTVYLATVLFLAGVVTKIKGRLARMVIDILGLGMLIYCIFRLAFLPVA